MTVLADHPMSRRRIRRRDFLSPVVLVLLGATTVHAKEPRSICYQVIEGQPDVAPAAPILVDRCSGKSFVLSRGRSGSRSYKWVAISKATDVSPRAARRPTARANPSIRGGDNKGCFTFNGRSYCP
jgi:hypothetical protein